MVENLGNHEIKILIIEDDYEDFYLIKRKLLEHKFLQDNIYHTTFINNVEQDFIDKKVDAILLDLNIEDSSGVNTFYSVSKIFPHIPVIILSGISDVNMAIESVRMGAQDYITKFELNSVNLSKTIKYSIERNLLICQIRKNAQFKSKFLAQMSHEIRTPLNGVIGLVDVLKKEQSLSTQQHEIINTIARCGKHLIDIVSDILDISKIEAGKFVINNKKLNLSEVIENSITIFSNVATQKNLIVYNKYDSTIPNYVISDPIRLSQVFSNLIGNAIKFTQAGFIEIEIKLLEANNNIGSYEFLIHDTGQGIDQISPMNLFDEYLQVDNLNDDYDVRSTGLGLSICKEIVNQLNGNIQYYSNEYKGTTFQVNLDFPIIDQKTYENVGIPTKDYVILTENDELKNILLKQFTSWTKKPIFAGNLSNFIASDINLKNIQFIMIEWNDQFELNNFKILLEFLNTENIPIFFLSAKICQIPSDLQSYVWHFGQPLQSKIIEKILNIDNKITDQIKNQEKILQSAHSKILVVDDDPVNQIVLSKMIEALGHHPIEALDGLQALNTVKNNTIDLILMDCNMPHLNGYETTSEIRKMTYPISETPIIALTANAFTEDRKRCLDAGMDDFLSKPITLDVLQNKIEYFQSYSRSLKKSC